MAPSNSRQVTAYVDCFSGISGDMFLGALLNAGLPLDVLTDTLDQVDLSGYQILCHQKTRHSAIQGTQLQVKLTGDPPSRDWHDIHDLLLTSRLSESVKARAIAIFQVLAAAKSTSQKLIMVIRSPALPSRAVAPLRMIWPKPGAAAMA